MKKITIFFLLLAVSAATFCQQEATKPDSAKKIYSYFLKIKTMEGEKILTVLSRFSENSIFIISYDKKYIVMGGFFKVVRKDEETGIPIEKIRTISFKRDRTIFDPDTLKKYKSEIIEKNIGLEILSTGFNATLGSIPIPAGGGLEAISTINTVAIITVAVTAAVAGALVLSDGKKFALNGKKEKYNEMMLILTGVKKKNDNSN